MTSSWSYVRTFTTQVLSKIVKIPMKKISLRDNLSYIVLERDKKIKYNLLIIRGGCVWNEKDIPSYIKPFYYLPGFRSFIPEMDKPVCNLQVHHEIKEIVEDIKKNYTEPLIIIGMSMGGTHSINYMYHYPDDCIYYISSCTPLDLYRMSYLIEADSFYRIIAKKTMEHLSISTYEELYQKASLNIDDFNKQMLEFSDMLCEMGHWPEEKKRKFISFLPTDDSLVRGYFIDQKYYNFPLEIYQINGTSHCCYNMSMGIISWLKKLK